jgi:hypothetical protein
MVRNKGALASATDVGISVGAVLLSLTSAGFAAYFILLAPALNSGISRVPDTKYLASASEAESDPIVTGTTTKLKTYENAEKWGSETLRLAHYKIRAVSNNQVVFEIFHDYNSDIIVLKIGDIIPGIGKILAIDNLNGNWYLQTDHGRLASAGTIFN